MGSEKLRKYLAYYQKVLKAEPDNIEARLRLAAIFKELGREDHAVVEYAAASKLLAREGLPLEAIAACKAVLELEPTHSETAYFLARLYAQVPDAMTNSSRIARPVDSMVLRQTPTMAAPAPVPEPIELDRPVADEAEPTQVTNVADIAQQDTLPRRTTRPTPPPVPADANRRTRPVRPLRRPEADGVPRAPEFETFEVNVFDLNTLGLDESSEIDVAFLDEFEGEVSEFGLDEVSETYPAVYEVDRDNLPEIPLFSQLPPSAFMRLLTVIDLQRVPASTTILRPDNETKTLYIIVRGATRVTRVVDGQEIELDTLGVGDFFGEFALLTGRTGLASVRAVSDCELLAIHESVVNDLADEHPEIWDVLWDFYYARMLNNLLASSEIFRPLDAPTRNLLAERFELREVVADTLLLSEGEPCRYLFLVLSGEVSAERRVGNSRKELARMGAGEFFGLASSLNDEPYLADLRAVRDTTLLLLPSHAFRELTNANREVLRAVERVIASRRALNPLFTSGITDYAVHGVAKFD